MDDVTAYLDAAAWRRILVASGVKPATADRWADRFRQHAQPIAFSRIDETDDFLGQVLLESAMLERVEEILLYSAPRLCAVWPSRFPTLAAARPYAGAPERLAEKVYGGRLGNTRPGDGWRYRGRGLVQITGRWNYAAMERLMGLPLLDRPDLLTVPSLALRAAVLWWEGNVPDEAIGSVERVTRAVQGGQQELERRRTLTARARDALQREAVA